MTDFTAAAAADDAALQHSPLHDSHLELGATMGPFGGWEMPISYADGGVVAEHTAVRTSVGVFDVSHLGKVSVAGPGAVDFINSCFTADLRKIGPGQAQYTLCCNSSGGVVDDLIAYVVADDEVLLIPNAANTAAVVAALHEVAPAQITITNRHREFGVIAVQGPRAAEVLAELGLPTDLDYMSWLDAAFDGAPVRVCRTGYTGEQGFELLPSWQGAPALWQALLAVIEGYDGLPAGLGARDTLRTEMGYPLHGQDLSLEISPVQARATWAVGWKKDAFFGRDALVAEREAGPGRTLRGLEAIDRGVLRPGLEVTSDDGTVVGHTTSGTFSPTLGRSIALALIDTGAEVSDGDVVTVLVRNRKVRATVRKTPFVQSHVR